MALWVCLMVAYWTQSDRTAALFAYPVIGWGLLVGIPSFVLWVVLGSRLSAASLLLWLLTVVLVSDAMPGLARLGLKPAHIRSSDKWSCRLLSLDCLNATSIPPDAIEAGQVDLIFLQNLQSVNLAYALAQRVFGKYALVRVYKDSAIIARSGELSGVRSLGDGASFSVDWLPGRLFTPQPEAPIRLVNVSFEDYPKNRNLFLPSCWEAHSELRATHLHEVRLMLEKLKKLGKRYGEFSLICAGACNAPAGAPIYDLLDQVFVDSYGVAGVGNGGNYPKWLPYLRLSRVLLTSPLRAAYVSSIHLRKIKHLAVIAEIYQQ